jgi:hypothetical protein
MMFKHFPHCSITVPACTEHNTEKTNRDQSIVTAIVMLARQYLDTHPQSQLLTPNVRKSIALLETAFHQAKNQVQLRNYLVSHTASTTSSLPYIQPSVQIVQWTRELTAALMWSILGHRDSVCNWDDARSWSHSYHSKLPDPICVDDTDATRKALEYWADKEEFESFLNGLPWTRGWSAGYYPEDIYFFETYLDKICKDDIAAIVYFRHRFFNGLVTWLVVFPCSQETVTRLHAVYQ